MSQPILIHAHADSLAFLIADHASAHVPADIDLRIDRALIDTHIAIDIGVADVAQRLGLPGVLGGVSRLVIDLNREADHPGLVPVESDGHVLPGNIIDEAARAQRIEQFWNPYHATIAAEIARRAPRLLVSLHSFTPRLASRPAHARPWEIGVLYNRDNRAARIAIPLLEGSGIFVGDQEPYSGTQLNATMNRHGETNGIAYLGLEVRQDLISDPAGVARWADLLSPVIAATVAAL